MNADRKSESRRKAASNVGPTPPPIGRTPDAMVVLLIENVSEAWCPHHVVDAMSDFAVAWCSGMGVFCAGLRI